MTRAFTASRRQLTALRLSAQHIYGDPFATPADAVRHLFGVQAQDFPGAKWTVGLRVAGSTDASIEQALADRLIVRSWPMRGTLHFVAPEDLGWMTRLTSPRLISGYAKRHRDLELDDRDFATVVDTARAELSGGRTLTRDALLAAFTAAGVHTTGQRAAHLLVNLAQNGHIVFAHVEGKQHTFALLDEWVEHPRDLSGDEALAEFARRYFVGHGPATVRDLAWWASLTLTDARTGLAIVRDELDELVVDDTSYFLPKDAVAAPAALHLLPGFDEYILGYQDRSAPLAPEHFEAIVPGGNGMFMPTIVSDGEVVGTWKRTVTPKKVVVNALPFEPLSAANRTRVERAARPLGRFLDRPVEFAG